MSNAAENIQTAITTIVELYADKFPSFSFSVNLYVDKLAVQILCFKSCAGLTFYADNSVSPTSFTLAAKPNSYILQIMENCAKTVETKIAEHDATAAPALQFQPKYYEVPISITNTEGSPDYTKGLTSSKLWGPVKHKPTPKKFTSLTAMYTPPKAHKEKPKSAWQMKQEAEQKAAMQNAIKSNKSSLDEMAVALSDAMTDLNANEFFTVSPLLEYLKSPKYLHPAAKAYIESIAAAAPAEPLADPSGPAPLKSLQLEMCDFVQQNEEK